MAKTAVLRMSGAPRHAGGHVVSLSLPGDAQHWQSPINEHFSLRSINDLILTCEAVCRFLWAYQQLVDLRYEWAVKSDPLPDTPEGSPQSDALYYLGEGTLAGNASLQPPASLAFYMAALEANARNITSQGSLAGAGCSLFCLPVSAFNITFSSCPTG